MFEYKENKKCFDKLVLFMTDRVGTGVPGLDERIEGGFPKSSVSLVTGGPGSGKTTFCSQFVEEGLKNGDKCLYITTGQKPRAVREDAEEFGIDLDHDELTMAEISPSNDVAEDIRKQVAGQSFDRIVLDSLSVFELHWGEKDHLRKYINKLMDHFRDINATVVVTSERDGSSGRLSRFGIAEYVVDAVILLQGYALGETAYRSARIIKMRRTQLDGNVLSLEIGDKGISLESEEEF